MQAASCLGAGKPRRQAIGCGGDSSPQVQRGTVRALLQEALWTSYSRRSP